jgi:hypothetical protein
MIEDSSETPRTAREGQAPPGQDFVSANEGNFVVEFPPASVAAVNIQLN